MIDREAHSEIPPESEYGRDGVPTRPSRENGNGTPPQAGPYTVTPGGQIRPPGEYDPARRDVLILEGGA